MSFLQKFRGKTTLLKKEEVKDILGERGSTIKNKIKNSQGALIRFTEVPNERYFDSKSIANQSILKRKRKIEKQSSKSQLKQRVQSPENVSNNKKVIQNPYLVLNQFYLDEDQHKQYLTQRKQQEYNRLIEKQRKRKEKIHQKMIKSIQLSPLKIKQFTKKQWVKLGGLGANIGSEEWNRKNNLRQKMIKFSQQTKTMNKNKLQSQSLNIRSQKSITENTKINISNSKQMPIRQTKTIQKPNLYPIQRPKYKSIEIQSLSQQNNHKLLPSLKKKSFTKSDSTVNPMQNQSNRYEFYLNYSQLQMYQKRHSKLKKIINQNF